MKNKIWIAERLLVAPSLIVVLIMSVLIMVGCGSNENKDTGKPADSEKKSIPDYMKIKHVDISDKIDVAMVKGGTEVFETKCSACHKLDERYVGPSLRDVTVKRKPEYIMNMILDSETMIENDDTVKCLLQTFMLKMPNQHVDEKDARNVLEYLRDVAVKK